MDKYLQRAETLALDWRLSSGATRANTRPRPVQTIGVIGAGVMGERIAVAMLQHGFSVILVDSNVTTLTRAASVIAKDVSSAAARFTKSTSLEDIRSVDLIIETVFENLKLKQEVFRKLSDICKPDAILATNTSTLDIDEIGIHVRGAERVVGLHFFNPSDKVRLVEVIYGKRTSAHALATVFDVALLCKKLPIVMKSGPGFCGNRMFSPYLCQACQLIEEGFLPEEIDQALCEVGFAIGPFKTMDLIGMDTMRRVQSEQKWPLPEIVQEMVESGRLGRKSGVGWYVYEKSGRRRNDEGFLAKLRERYPPKSQRVSNSDIVNLCLFPLIAEGFKLLEDGYMHRPADIDLVWVFGYGWPASTGGPIRFALEHGLMQVFAECYRQYDRTQRSFWKPCELMYEVAKLKPLEYSAWLEREWKGLKSGSKL